MHEKMATYQYTLREIKRRLNYAPKESSKKKAQSLSVCTHNTGRKKIKSHDLKRLLFEYLELGFVDLLQL